MEGQMTPAGSKQFSYGDERASFCLDVPEYFNFARDVVGRWAEDPAKRAMLWVDEHGAKRDLTFRHFADQSSKLADGLRALGIKRGDSVLVIIPPVPEWWETFMALMDWKKI
ncbi:MAG: AMP-binding protein, partial [Chloroflexi bacterium]|nr:AMP-binding protein [Chloroflexota bacterium]